jgi:hypothetical protein
VTSAFDRLVLNQEKHRKKRFNLLVDILHDVRTTQDRREFNEYQKSVLFVVNSVISMEENLLKRTVLRNEFFELNIAPALKVLHFDIFDICRKWNSIQIKKSKNRFKYFGVYVKRIKKKDWIY